MKTDKQNRRPMRRRKRETLLRSSDFMNQFHPSDCIYSNVHARTEQGGTVVTAVMTRDEFDTWSRSR